MQLRMFRKTRKYWCWVQDWYTSSNIASYFPLWHYCNTNYFTPLHYIGTANTHTNTNTRANTNNKCTNKYKYKNLSFLAVALLEQQLLHSLPLYCNNSNYCSLCHCRLLIACPTSVQLLLLNGDRGNDYGWCWRRTCERERVKSKWGWCGYIL